MEIFIAIAVLWVVPIYIAYQQGKAKNRNGFVWGFLLGWLGVISLAFLPPSKTPAEPAPWETDEIVKRWKDKG